MFKIMDFSTFMNFLMRLLKLFSSCPLSTIVTSAYTVHYNNEMHKQVAFVTVSFAVACKSSKLTKNVKPRDTEI